ncbi:MAG TPA: potassium/proton antiporter [Longimicrobiales bacterium]|nr:potassium/proton antiporter [Longimicrobiales bacterium]
MLVDRIVLLAGVLLLVGIASSKASARVGVPVLVLFMLVGMLAGSEGLGGVAFEDYTIAHGVGTVALALILFDGGLRSPTEALRMVWKPALSLATLGVVLTSLVAGLAASYILDISPLEGLLFGAIVGSTDAAAVFGVLRTGGVRLDKRLAATLEVESASNDPMAIFLTVGLIEVLMGRADAGLDLAVLFLRQFSVGGIVGLGAGWMGARLINRLNLEAAGMYPLLATGVGLVSFGLAALLGGSGFLAVYLTGVWLGNTRLVFQRGIFFFHDAAAWLGQILMFATLGLLSFPSRLVAVAPQGVMIALALALVARPVAVLISALPFGYTRRELVMVAWTGLKGAVPITLATFPLTAGVSIGPLLFDVVFFVVLISAAVQGMSLAFVARKLGLEAAPQPEAPISLEITSLKDVDGDIVEYTISEGSRASGRLIRDLALPDGVVVALLARGHHIIPPKGSTRVLPGDHAFVVLRPNLRPLVDRVFSREVERRSEPLPFGEFPLRGSTRIAELEEYYGIGVHGEPGWTLSELIRQRMGADEIRVGARVDAGPVTLVIHELDGAGHVELVGLEVHDTGEEGAEPADVADEEGEPGASAIGA